MVLIQDMADPLIRAALSAAERSLRSRIAQLTTGVRFLRGTLSDRSSRCGKPNCHCANGATYPNLYRGQMRRGVVLGTNG
jgi:hypothetical protein